MVKRILCMVALAFGCDDPEVETLVVGALQHGAMTAHVECGVSADFGTYGVAPLQAEGVLFLDGTAFASGSTGYGSGASFNPRLTLEPSVRWFINDDQVDLLFAEGSLTVKVETVLEDTIDLDTECTGFNLEAFGVE